MRLRDQLRLDRALVDLLHPARRLLLRQLRDLLELALGSLVAGEDALEVEHAEAAELAELDRDLRRDDAVHRGGEQRQLEQVRAELPADVHVLRVARPPGRHDRDVVEPVCLPRLLAPADLDLHRLPPLDAQRPRRFDRLGRKSVLAAASQVDGDGTTVLRRLTHCRRARAGPLRPNRSVVRPRAGSNRPGADLERRGGAGRDRARAAPPRPSARRAGPRGRRRAGRRRRRPPRPARPAARPRGSGCVSRSSRRSAKQPDSRVISTFRAPSSAIVSRP